jgi:hypothetical protein
VSAANQYLLRHPFSLQKITWNATSKTVIYRSKRHHNTKRNFEIFKAPDFIAAAKRILGKAAPRATLTANENRRKFSQFHQIPASSGAFFLSAFQFSAFQIYPNSPFPPQPPDTPSQTGSVLYSPP